MKSLANHLSATIPTHQALLAVLLSDIGIGVLFFYSLSLERKLKKLAEKYNTDVALLRESIKILLDDSTTETRMKLDEHLNYWQIVYPKD